MSQLLNLWLRTPVTFLKTHIEDRSVTSAYTGPLPSTGSPQPVIFRTFSRPPRSMGSKSDLLGVFVSQGATLWIY